MAQEVENYLKDKLSEGLESSKVSLRKDIQKLQKLIEDKLSSSPAPTTADMSVLREKLYCLNNIFAECQTLPIFTLEGLVSRWKIRRNLKTMKDELNRMTANGDVTPDENPKQGSSNGRAVVRHHRSSQSIDPSKVYGFDDEIMSMVKLLVYRGSSDEFRAVGITGMAGTGKSTLCKVLLTRQEVKNRFLPRIWVSISEKPQESSDAKVALAERMLDSLGVEEKIVKSISDKQGLTGLICALHVQLMGKRYLIILDDAQNTDDWYGNLNSPLPHNVKWEERLAYGLPKGHGGTVIVTSRSEDLTKKMVEKEKKMVEDENKKMVKEENMHRLLPLSDEDKCWLIFKDVVEEDGTPFNPPNVESEEDLKKEIINKCAGLPLAAKMIGELMKEAIKEAAVPNGHAATIQPQQSNDSNSSV